MAKRVKTKKGSIGKKALAAILAASMVLSSSAFSVLAADLAVAADPSKTVKADGAVVTVTFGDPVNGKTIEYTGKDIKPEVTVAVTGYDTDGNTVTDTSRPALEENKDYTLSWKDTKEAGTASVTVTFRTNAAAGDYNYVNVAPKTETFTITPYNLATHNAKVKMSGQPSREYTGGEYCPTYTVTATVGGEAKTLVEGTDYELVNGSGDELDKVNAGTKTVQIKGINNYQGTVAADGYEIDPAELSTPKVTIESRDVAYKSGAGITATDVLNNVVVKDAVTGNELTVGTYKASPGAGDSDYLMGFYDSTTAEYKAATPETAPGTHKFRIYPNSAKTLNYKGGYAEGSYNVVASLQAAANNATIPGYISAGKTAANAPQYDGSNKWSAFKTTFDSAEYILPDIAKSEYELVTKDAEWINAGVYDVQIKGKGRYAGEDATIKIEVLPRVMNTAAKDDSVDNDKLNDMKLTAVQGTTRAKKLTDPVVTIVDSGLKDAKGNYLNKPVTLVEGTDYSFKTKTANGKTTVVVTGMGNYTTKIAGGNVKTYEREVTASSKLPLGSKLITAAVKEGVKWTEGGVLIQPEDIVVVDTEDPAYTLAPIVGGVGDYYVIAQSSVKSGTATVTIKATDSSRYYTGTRDIEFKINGEAEFSSIVWFDTIEDIKLTATKTAATASEAIAAARNRVKYIDGNGIYRNVDLKVVDKDGKTYTDDLPVGEYKVVATDSTGRYEGSVEKEFKVVGEDISSYVMVEAINDRTYTGSAIEPELTVKWDESNKGDGVYEKTLEKGKDYTVTYEDNVNAGVAKAVVSIIVTGKSGTIEKAFTIKKADATVDLDADQKNELANGVAAGTTMTLKLTASVPDETLSYTVTPDASGVVEADGTTLKFVKAGDANVTITPTSRNLNLTPVSITVPVKVTGESSAKKLVASCTPSTLKNVKNSFTVTTNTVKGADKWVIRYSLKNLNKTTKGSAKATFKNTKKVVQQVVKVNKSGAKYYVQCRVIKNGKKSAWSKVKTVTSR